MSVFDDLRFGAQRTLNLREHLPSSAEAVRRCEAWLREQQIRRSEEVLVITGRGSQSVGGVPILKPAVEKLLFSLRRRGVVASHREHNPGAFAVTLAPLRALADAPARRREVPRRAPAFAFDGLSSDTIALLRELAERALHHLGVTMNERVLRDEMHRQLGALGPGITPDEGMEDRLRDALRSAIADYE